MIKYKNSQTFHLKFYDKYIAVVSMRQLYLGMGHGAVHTDITIEPDATTALIIQSGHINDCIMSYAIVGNQQLVIRYLNNSNNIHYYDEGDPVAHIIPVALAYPKIEFLHL